MEVSRSHGNHLAQTADLERSGGVLQVSQAELPNGIAAPSPECAVAPGSQTMVVARSDSARVRKRRYLDRNRASCECAVPNSPFPLFPQDQTVPSTFSARLCVVLPASAST